MPPRVIRAVSMGYCMGVQNAIDYAERALSQNSKVYSHGPLIHNNKELARLASRGMHVMEEDIPIEEGATVVVRAHGIHPQERAKIKAQNVAIIDATCPLVLVNQKTVRRKSNEGAVVVIAGHAGHAEMQALVGFADSYLIVETLEDVGRLDLDINKTYFLLAQTTLQPAVFEQIQQAMRQRIPHVEIFNSICAATKERQQAIKGLAPQVDAIVVVGDRKSANSRGLVALAESLGRKCYLVEGPEDVTVEMKSYTKIGLSAAASAPGWLIDNVETALVT